MWFLWYCKYSPLRGRFVIVIRQPMRIIRQIYCFADEKAFFVEKVLLAGIRFLRHAITRASMVLLVCFLLYLGKLLKRRF